MDAGVTSFRSILDKPLTQLTEEDISQLTREDCRKFLKEKGMRRPSWNKSQAIQQVISLKALLETSEDSGAGALRRILVSRPPATQNSADSAKEASADANNAVSASVEESAPCRQNDSPKSAPPAPQDFSEEAEDKARSPGATNGYIGQMTIFYCGKVNVYDGVPPDKARAIMHLAASPIQLPPDDPVRGTSAFPFPCHVPTPSERHCLIPPSATITHSLQTEKLTEYYQHCGEKSNIPYEPDVEGQVNRQVSLQRYREKRRDRGRFKGRKSVGSMSSSLEVYLNHHARTPTGNGQLSGGGSSSPHQVGLPHNLCSSADNQAKSANLSVDLNEDVQDR